MGLVLDRQQFLKSTMAAAAGALILPSLERDVEYVRRVWALGAIKSAVAATMKDGWIVQSSDGRLTIVVETLDGLGVGPLTGRVIIPEKLSPTVENDSHNRLGYMGIEINDAPMQTITGRVYITQVGQPLAVKPQLIVARS